MVQNGPSKKAHKEVYDKRLTLQSLFFFDFLAFFRFRFPLLFCAFFLSFPRILGVPRREKPPCIFRGFPCFFSKKQGLEGQGLEAPQRPQAPGWPRDRIGTGNWSRRNRFSRNQSPEVGTRWPFTGVSRALQARNPKKV